MKRIFKKKDRVKMTEVARKMLFPDNDSPILGTVVSDNDTYYNDLIRVKIGGRSHPDTYHKSFWRKIK